MVQKIILYKITNKINGKSYVGWTSKPLKKRWNQHKSPSSPCTLLRNAIQKNGVDNFIREELEICLTESYAKLLEIAAIKGFNTKFPNGYNMTDGGDGALGYKHSEQTKQKMRGQPRSEKHRQRLREARKGYYHSEETKRKMSQANKGQGLGRKLSTDTRQKISETKRLRHIPIID